MIILKNGIYNYEMIDFSKEVNMSNRPHKGDYIKIIPYAYRRIVERVILDIDTDEVEVNLADREFGYHDGRKEKNLMKKGDKTKAQIEYEKLIKTFKDNGWKEKERKE